MEFPLKYLFLFIGQIQMSSPLGILGQKPHYSTHISFLKLTVELNYTI